MDIEKLDQRAALQLIGRLKAGRNVIFGAQLFSVGRQSLIRGAEQVFKDIQVTGDSVVRFIRGNSGVGKTNFSARLFNHALGAGWTAAYVELSEKVTLHEFQHVFSEVINKLYTPRQLLENPLDPGLPNGFIGILDIYYKELRSAVGLEIGSDIPSNLRSDILTRVNTILTRWHIYSDFASAVRSYFQAKLDGDHETLELIKRWFRADPEIRIKELGILRPIHKLNAKDHLRSLSCILLAFGYRGVLIILDELERIMQESRTRRIKAYTILRELMDNVDGENGMVNTCFYCAAPPAQFESQKGFIEVEPLASRIQEPVMANKGDVDPTGAIVNLDKSPLIRVDQIELAKRILQLFRIARQCSFPDLNDNAIEGVVTQILKRRPYCDSRVRDFCVELISVLEHRYAESRA
jgi:hypothetical protein